MTAPGSDGGSNGMTSESRNVRAATVICGTTAVRFTEGMCGRSPRYDAQTVRGDGPMTKWSVPPEAISSCSRYDLVISFPFSSADWMYLFREEFRPAAMTNVFPFSRRTVAFGKSGEPTQ